MASDAQARAEARIDPATGQFTSLSWTEVRDIIRTNQLSLLTRSPAQLADYQAWKQQTVSKYGSVEQYILQQRLKWTRPIVPKHKRLFGEGDYQILWNDFPYAFAQGIQHLVVWTKFAFPHHDGQLTEETRLQVEEFVAETFGDDGNVLYFMNPPSLKSIGNLEHFHVLLKDKDGKTFLTSTD